MDYYDKSRINLQNNDNGAHFFVSSKFDIFCQLDIQISSFDKMANVISIYWQTKTQNHIWITLKNKNKKTAHIPLYRINLTLSVNSAIQTSSLDKI